MAATQDDKALDIIAQFERRKADRGVFESHWQQCANYIQPSRNDYLTERTPGQKRMTLIYDSHPLWALEQFQAGCHGFLTSDTVLWFAARADEDRVDNIPRVRKWFELATDAMYAVLNSPRYNFAGQSHEIYGDIGNIGSATMAVLEGRMGMPLFSARHMKECVWAENEEDRVDTLIRRFPFTAKQAVAQWGDKAGDGPKKAMADNKPDQKFHFLHAVRPRRDRDPQRADTKNMRFESVYVCEADKTVIAESGFNEFPFLTPRFSKLTGEIYGRGPGMTALPDVKMLNEGVKLVLKAAQKVIDPPLDLPDDAYVVPVRTLPGSLNYRRPNMRPDDGIRPILTQGNIPIGQEMIDRIYNSIDKVFFVDLLRMPSDPSDPSSEGKGTPATYWLQRREKEMMALGPFLTRMKSEWTGPLIDRVFASLWRKSKALRFGPGSPFPPPPPELAGARWHVEYTSPLAIAQKSSEQDAVDRLIATQAQFRQIDPQSPIILDFEAILRMKQRDLNAPIDTLKTAERLQQEAQQEADAQQAMANHAALANVAGAAKDGSAALKNLRDAGGNDNEQAEAA